MPRWLRSLIDLFLKPLPVPEPIPLPVPEPIPPPLVNPAMEVLRAMINGERVRLGLPLLLANGRLEAAAQGHALDMATHNRLDHTGSDGSSFVDRFARVGYVMKSGGEIIAGQAGPRMNEEEVVSMWLQSPGHRDRIMSTDYFELGAGESGNYWAVCFGRR